MNIKTERTNGCPIMTVTKGNFTFVYGGMDLILGKAIIKLDDADGYVEVTDIGLVMELESKVINEEESKELCRVANEFLAE